MQISLNWTNIIIFRLAVDSYLIIAFLALQKYWKKVISDQVVLKLSLIFIYASDSTDALSSKDDSKCSFWPQSPCPVRLPPAQLGPLLPITGLVSEWTQLYLAEELALVTGPASGCILSTNMDLRPLNFFPLFFSNLSLIF